MDVTKYYIEKGVKSSEFVQLFGKIHPIKTVPAKKEPKFIPVNKEYKVPECIENTPQYRHALKLAEKSILFDGIITHVDRVGENKFFVRPLRYSIRTAFVSFADVEYMNFTLRDQVFPRPFSHGGEFEGINNYPYPKPTGVNVLLVDPENNLIIQKRGNLLFDPRTYAATAAGAIDWETVINSKNPLKTTIYQELKEELQYTGKINDLKYIGYVLNYKHLLDISHIYIGYLDEEVNENIQNIEVSGIIKIPLDNFKNTEKIIRKKIPTNSMSTVLIGAIDLINKI